MERLLLTLPCERGELFYISAGRRILLANCNPCIEIYERTSYVSAIGGTGVKTIHAALALCGEPDFTRPADVDFLKKVDGFDLSADIQRKDGVFELFHFRNMQLYEINCNNEWTFELNERQEVLRKLLTL